MKVIGWMEKHAISWADAGHIPAYKSITESSEYKAMQPNATYASLAEAAVFDPKTTITGVASPPMTPLSTSSPLPFRAS